LDIIEIQKQLAINAAIESNVIKTINDNSKGMMAEEIATSLFLNPHVLKELTDVLDILGIINQSESGIIVLTREGKELLLSGKKTEFHQDDSFPDNNRLKNWFRLTEILSGANFTGTGDSCVFNEKHSGKRRTFKVISTLDSAGVLDGVETVLDVGGGPLTYAPGFIGSNKVTSVTVQDLPPVVRKMTEESSRLKGIKWFSGDCLKILPSNRFDLTFLANITHIFSTSENEQLFKRLASITDQYIVIVDNFKEKTLESSLFSLHIAINTAEGRIYTIEEYTNWIEGARFTVKNIVDIQKNRAQMIVAEPD